MIFLKLNNFIIQSGEKDIFMDILTTVFRFHEGGIKEEALITYHIY